MFAIWKLPVEDVDGSRAEIPFYLTEGKGILLLGNEILHRSNALGSKQILEIPAGVRRISNKTLRLQTFFEPLSKKDPEIGRSYLLVVPSKFKSFGSFLSHGRPHECTKADKYHDSSLKRFAYKLHGYSHLHFEDMVTLCKRGGVLTKELKRHLLDAYNKCTSCREVGRPYNSKKVSFKKVFAGFNDSVQIDFCYVTELSKNPILHVVDTSTGYSATRLCDTRYMDEAMVSLEEIWIHIHGSPRSLSADPEFLNKFTKDLNYYHIQFIPVPARRHNKIGVVERKNSVLRMLVQKLLKDAEYARKTRSVSVSVKEILSRGTFLSNILYGNKMLSSFELARGYTPALVGLPQSPLSSALIDSHHEQVARRAISLFRKSNKPNAPTAKDFSKDDPVYFFKRGAKFGVWEKAFVREVKPQSLLLSRNVSHRGKAIHAAYEDVRSVPSNPLLKDLDEYEFLFPRSHSIVPDLPEYERDQDDEGAELFPEIDDTETQAKPVDDEDPPGVGRNVSFAPVEEEIGDLDRSVEQLDDDPSLFLDLESESSLWCEHMFPQNDSQVVRSSKRNNTERDIGPHAFAHHKSLVSNEVHNLNQPRDPPEVPEKDIGTVPIKSPPSKPFRLKSSEQEVLRHVRDVIGTETVSESRLQFAPQWLISKSIQKEKDNYQKKEAYEEVDVRTLPKGSNIISSHHFFQVKNDGDEETLKLKCRLVPHGNRDKDKDEVRKDSSTAQFLIIRIVLSILAMFNFCFATIDIESAYLQGGPIQREIYMRPPKGWVSPYVVWKLKKYAYGISESGRIWQLVVDGWLHSQKFEEIPGLPQLFILRDEKGRISMALCKVVDDILVVGSYDNITRFYESISARFTVGRYHRDQEVIFNGLRIRKTKAGHVIYDMISYFNEIRSIEIPRFRRKDPTSKCTEDERTQFLSLTGSLNWLGHGVLPQASFAASYLQQMTGNLIVGTLVTANKVLQEIKQLKPEATMLSPTKTGDETYLAFSDASQGKSCYGQTGYVSGIFLPAGGVFHALDWQSCKQSRVAFSSIGAEILAAATSADRGSMLAERLPIVFGSPSSLPFALTVDSNGLYSTITTLHEGHDYRLRPTVSRMRSSYEESEIHIMQWIPGPSNISDALTKRNLATYKKLNDVLVKGFIPGDILQQAKRVSFTQQV